MKTPYQYFPIISPIYRSARQVFRSLFYKGDKVNCPVCGCTFKSWIGNRKFGPCPHCESTHRQRLLWLYLNLDSNSTDKILHFAPEKGLQTKFKSMPHLEYVTSDISAPEVDVHEDLTDLSFQNNTFDVIICSHVLEHIPDDRAAMAEIYRVLASNGTAYIQVPYNRFQETDECPSITDPLEREKRFGQFDHVRFYGTDFSSRLESIGFQVKEYYASQLNETKTELWQKYGIWNDVIFCCSKP